MTNASCVEQDLVSEAELDGLVAELARHHAEVRSGGVCWLR